MRQEPEAISAVIPHTLAFSLSVNLSVKVLRPHFPFNDLLDSGMENQRGVFLNSELETQTQRHRISPLPQRPPLSLVIHEDGAMGVLDISISIF